jgi:hypothetical protein
MVCVLCFVCNSPIFFLVDSFGFLPQRSLLYFQFYFLCIIQFTSYEYDHLFIFHTFNMIICTLFVFLYLALTTFSMFSTFSCVFVFLLFFFVFPLPRWIFSILIQNVLFL